MTNRNFLALAICLSCLGWGAFCYAAPNVADVPQATTEGELFLVKEGGSALPIVVFADAPPFTMQAADQLASYIEKTAGVKPTILHGEPSPLPDRAIWVGHQPVINQLFPNIDFDFKHPEEILIAANDKHLVIAGRDRWDPQHMTTQDRRGREIVGI